MAEKKLILALDYGGTKHSAAVIAVGGKEWLGHDRVKSPKGADGKYDYETMNRMARGLLKQVKGELAAVGVSFGGAVDGLTGKVWLSHHVPGWENFPLREKLGAEFKVPCAVDNDAHVAGLGEHVYGAGKGGKSLFYVTISTGIGGGWILDGKIFHGAEGMAGQLGHVVVNPGGMECVCGKRGCLEAEACGPAIAKKILCRLGAEAPEQMTGEVAAQAAMAGERIAQEVMDEAAKMLGIGLGGAINLMNPEIAVLGGGVTKSGERWWKIVRETARYHALPEMRVNIQPAALGDDAPLWGAVALAESLL
jgi:glucokinase